MIDANFRGAVPIFNARTKLTKFFNAAERQQLIAAVIEDGARDDVYESISTIKSGLSPSQRGSAAQVLDLHGFMIDADLASNKASHRKYPHDEEEADRIMGTLPFRCTAKVHTGNGLHYHFGLPTAFRVETEEDRERAKQIWKGFVRAMQAKFREFDREIDPVSDITRAYRLPGTFNHKGTAPKSVVCLELHPDRRTPLEAVEAFVAAQTSKAALRPRGKRRNNASRPPITKRSWPAAPGCARCPAPAQRPARSPTGTRGSASPGGATTASA